MEPYSTYTSHNGRWLVTLAIGLVVLATAYSRATAPAWYWDLPAADVALASGEPRDFFQHLTTDNPLVLPVSKPLAGATASTAAGWRPAGAWHPVAQWLAAGGSLEAQPARLPEVGWPLATNQADGQGAGRPQNAFATRSRLASAAGPLREE